MQVFKLFYKIVWHYKLSVFILMAIGLAYAVVFVDSGSNQVDVSGSDAYVVIFDADNSEFSKGLIEYLDDNVNIVEMDEEEVENALFYNGIDYVLYIPSGYEDSIMNDEKINFEKKSSAKSTSTWVVNNYVENYSNTLQNYFNSGLSIQETLDKASDSLNVEVVYESKGDRGSANVNAFFNFIFYSILGTVLSAIALVMIGLNKVDIKRRNVVSPISDVSMNLQVLAASISFAIILWAATSVFAYFYFADAMKEPASYLYSLNLFVLLFPVVSLTYLIVFNIKNPDALSGISNVVSLGMAFLGGSFVPQSMLGSGVIAVAKFIPSYWYVNTNDKIIELSNLDDLSPIYNNMIILTCFGVFYVLCTIVMSRFRRKNIQ